MPPDWTRQAFFGLGRVFLALGWFFVGSGIGLKIMARARPVG